METSGKNYSFAVLPFLKTSGRVSIGGVTFRSTDDTSDLSPEQEQCVREFSDMLFLQDNLRIKSASYALIPCVNLFLGPIDVKHLRNVQAVVAYCYALPRHEFGDLFLSPEHASMAILTPGNVLVDLLRPDLHVDAIGPGLDLTPNQRGEVEGYYGLYNFKHHLWVARGSRLYGPIQQLTPNRSQDLHADIHNCINGRADYRLLSRLLGKPDTSSYLRTFTALRWFNEANSEASEEPAAIVNLSIAFEALLGLPIEEKTDRLIDAISLLLGRIPRLDVWARQFYNARSEIVHGGNSSKLRFVPTGSPKKKVEGHLYQSLLSYGRQIFQLCLGTLLTGIALAEDAGLEDKLVTNQERFQKICMLLSDKDTGAHERLEHIVPILQAIERYKNVPEEGLEIETMIGAVRLAAKSLLDQNQVTSQELREQLELLSSAKRTDHHLAELEALKGLHKLIENKSVAEMLGCIEPVRYLVKVVWRYVFMHYFWIKKRHSSEGQNTKEIG